MPEFPYETCPVCGATIRGEYAGEDVVTLPSGTTVEGPFPAWREYVCGSMYMSDEDGGWKWPCPHAMRAVFLLLKQITNLASANTLQRSIIEQLQKDIEQHAH